jgi:hypothetical protein
MSREYFGWLWSSRTWPEAMEKANRLARLNEHAAHLKPAVRKSREHTTWAWQTGWVMRRKQ